jgi:ASCH domain
MRAVLSRALSLKQPWAWLIAMGIKRVELRSWWPEEPPGWILLHAGAKMECRATVEHVRARLTKTELRLFDQALQVGLPTSSFVAAVLIIECVGGGDVIRSQRRWFPEDMRHSSGANGKPWTHRLFPWWIRQSHQLDKAIPARGQLGLWTPETGARARALKELT